MPALRGRVRAGVPLGATRLPTTQRCSPAGARARRGRARRAPDRGPRTARPDLGRLGADVLGRALRPPPPGRALAGADARRGRGPSPTRSGHGATIKDPNDVLVDGRKVGGHPRRGRRAAWCSGSGSTSATTAWPGAGWVERDRLELLVDVLERLERGYDAWLGSRGDDGARGCRRRPAPRAESCDDGAARTGCVNVPCGSPSTMRVCWLTSTVTVAGSLSEKRSVVRVEQRQHRRRRVDRDRQRQLDVAERVGDRDDARCSSRRGAARRWRSRPSRASAGRAPSWPWNSVATTAPALLDVEPHRHVLRRARTRASVASLTPSPFGEIARRGSPTSPVSVRSTTTSADLVTLLVPRFAVTTSR